MKFNRSLIAILFAATAIVGISSCTEDEPIVFAKPTISNLEVGENNSFIGTIGGDLHLDAEIVAEGKIDKITVDLHPEGFVADDIEAEYTEYAGLLNVDFHKDLEIPDSAKAGEYHLHLTVIDQTGQSTGMDADVTLQ